MELVEENSTYNTSNFLKLLEDKVGFEIELVQKDNGTEFVNVLEQISKKSRFQKHLEKLNINIIEFDLTPYGKVA